MCDEMKDINVSWVRFCTWGDFGETLERVNVQSKYVMLGDEYAEKGIVISIFEEDNTAPNVSVELTEYDAKQLFEALRSVFD